MRFKEGDWVRNKRTGEIELLTEPIAHFYHSGSDIYEGKSELWEPKENEWCLFTNITDSRSILAQYGSEEVGLVNGLTNGLSYTKENFDCCEPFIGELPSLLKDKRTTTVKPER